ncbi:MAG: universal stress protein [Rhodobacteraceae bacterium]|nr:MAG: universal stress protein [Paracoccaceae bacterium]
MMTTTILAAVDRFPEDDAVLLRGREIAASHDAALCVVHVVDLPGDGASPAPIDTARGQAEFAARDRIEDALRRHGIDPADVEIRVDSGVPAQRLVEICDEIRPSLVVMRAHHKPRIVDKLLGSTTEKVIAWGQAPVLVVGPATGKPYQRVILAIDGPDSAPTALSFVSSLLPEADVHMVQAVEVAPQLEEAMLRVGLARTDLQAHHDALAQDAANRLGKLAERLDPPVTWQVLRGDAAEQLARVTHHSDVDLIALGPNRSGLLRRIFIGSVARRLLREAACDVLIGRPPDIELFDITAQRRGARPHGAEVFSPIAK